MVDVFFFRQKTAYDMLISDWSSDVCSSDLARIVDPLAQARAAVDHVDREHIVGVLIFEILAAPDRIIGIERPDRLEPQRLHAPRLERIVVVPRPIGMDMDAAAQLADMLVKGRLEPAVAYLASAEPLRRETLHFGAPRLGVQIVRAETFARG